MFSHFHLDQMYVYLSFEIEHDDEATSLQNSVKRENTGRKGAWSLHCLLMLVTVSANVTCQSCVMCAHVGGTLCHHIWKNKDGVMKQGLICDAHLLCIPAMWNTRPTVHP